MSLPMGYSFRGGHPINVSYCSLHLVFVPSTWCNNDTRTTEDAKGSIKLLGLQTINGVGYPWLEPRLDGVVRSDAQLS